MTDLKGLIFCGSKSFRIYTSTIFWVLKKASVHSKALPPHYVAERHEGKSLASGFGVKFTGHRQIIFVTVNGIGPLRGEGVHLKSVKNFTFVKKIEISNILL